MTLTLNWGLDSLLSLFFSHLMQYSLEGNQNAKATLKYDSELSSTFLGEKYLYQLFRILLHRFVYSSPSIYLSNHLSISVWTHGYLLYILGYNPVLDYLFCCWNFMSLTIGSSLCWLLCLFHKPHHFLFFIIIFLLALVYFLIHLIYSLLQP